MSTVHFTKDTFVDVYKRQIMSHGASLAIESTMINHAPEVKEKLQEVGIPVLIDQSSYETHPSVSYTHLPAG